MSPAARVVPVRSSRSINQTHKIEPTLVAGSQAPHAILLMHENDGPAMSGKRSAGAASARERKPVVEQMFGEFLSSLTFVEAAGFATAIGMIAYGLMGDGDEFDGDGDAGD